MRLKENILEQFDDYEVVQSEIEVSARFGSDYTDIKGEVEKYIDIFHPERMELTVSEIIEETPSTRTFRLSSPTRQLPPFLAGQYVTLFLEIDGICTSRPYSISSPPTARGYYDITVRRVENGLVSNYLLDAVQQGEKVSVSGPQGQFHYNPVIHDSTSVFIAGGSGITPFYSMIREIVERNLPRRVILFYGNRSLDDAIFHEDLAAIAERHENITYIPVVESPTDSYQCREGYISRELMREELKDLENKTFYLCGPGEMYSFCMPQLEALGLPPKKIRREIFGSPVRISEYPGWPGEISEDAEFSISVEGRGTMKGRAGESLLVTLEKEGIIIPSICRSGECSRCRVKLVKGKVFQPSGTPVRESDRRFGYIHSCVSFPLSDCEILV